jgi:hypothetical protein
MRMGLRFGHGHRTRVYPQASARHDFIPIRSPQYYGDPGWGIVLAGKNVVSLNADWLHSISMQPRKRSPSLATPVSAKC